MPLHHSHSQVIRMHLVSKKWLPDVEILKIRFGIVVCKFCRFIVFYWLHFFLILGVYYRHRLQFFHFRQLFLPVGGYYACCYASNSSKSRFYVNLLFSAWLEILVVCYPQSVSVQYDVQFFSVTLYKVFMVTIRGLISYCNKYTQVWTPKFTPTCAKKSSE